MAFSYVPFNIPKKSYVPFNLPVTIWTPDGDVYGRLAGVDWRNDPEFLQRARPYIAAAQADNVRWTREEDGITIWYMDLSPGEYRHLTDVICLNEKLRQLQGPLKQK